MDLFGGSRLTTEVVENQLKYLLKWLLHVAPTVGCWYLGFPCVKGMYLYFIICRICLFIVMQRRVIKYITKIGQKTGTLKQSKSVQTKPIKVDLTIPSQNLNSGRRRMNGRNSRDVCVGRPTPSSS